MSKVVQVRLRWYSAVTPLTNVAVNRLTSVEVSDEEAELMLKRDKSRFFKLVDCKPDLSLVDGKPVAAEAEKGTDEKPVPKKRGRPKATPAVPAPESPAVEPPVVVEPPPAVV